VVRAGFHVRAGADYAIILPLYKSKNKKTVGVDPEICACGARIIVDDAITDGEKITETLARLGIVSTGLPKMRQSTGELDCVNDV
jgi:hypothetical protein